MEETYVGSIIWFDNRSGYGFIEWQKSGQAQKDLFVHFSDINCEGYKTVKKGEKVSFGLGLNNRGQPKATNVTVVTGVTYHYVNDQEKSKS
jgi:CspA family cold shock protein